MALAGWADDLRLVPVENTDMPSGSPACARAGFGLGRAVHGADRPAIRAARHEKLVIDIELWRMFEHELTPLEIDEVAAHLGRHEESEGRPLLRRVHTLERLRACFYPPSLISTDTSTAASATAGTTRLSARGQLTKTLGEY